MHLCEVGHSPNKPPTICSRSVQDVACAEALLAGGADLDALNVAGKNALDTAGSLLSNRWLPLIPALQCRMDD